MGQVTEEQLTSDIRDTRADLTRNVDELVDRVAPGRIVERRRQAVRDRFRRMRDSVMGTAGSGTHAVADARSGVAGRASSAADSVAGGAHDAADTIRARTEGSPLATGMIAFGLGALVGGLLPSTRAESQVAHRVVDTAKEQGQPVLDEAKAAAQEAGQHLTEHAREAAEEVRATAQESAQHVKAEGQDAAQTVRQDATS